MGRGGVGDGEEFGGDVLAGDVEVDGGVAGGGEVVVEDFEGEGGGIAVAAEVAEDDAAEAGGGNGGDEFGGLVVGKVSVAAGDALFGGPGALDVGGEEVRAVVGLDEEGVKVGEALVKDGGGVAEVADDAKTAASIGEEEADGIDGVVGDGEGVDVEAGGLKGGAGLDEAPAWLFFEVGGKDLAGVGIAVNGEVEGAEEDVEAAGVVAVLVGEEDALEGVRPYAEGVEPAAQLECGEPGVHKQGAVLSGDDGAVARAAAAEDGKMHKSRMAGERGNANFRPLDFFRRWGRVGCGIHAHDSLSGGGGPGGSRRHGGSRLAEGGGV